MVNLEGFGLQPADPAEAPDRYGKWLDQLRDSGRPSAPIPTGRPLRRGCGRTIRA